MLETILKKGNSMKTYRQILGKDICAPLTLSDAQREQWLLAPLGSKIREKFERWCEKQQVPCLMATLEPSSSGDDFYVQAIALPERDALFEEQKELGDFGRMGVFGLTDWDAKLTPERIEYTAFPVGVAIQYINDLVQILEHYVIKREAARQGYVECMVVYRTVSKEEKMA